MTIKQLSVFLENRPGALLEFTRLLRQHDINMRALCLAEVAEYGVIRVIVDDTYELMNVLKNEGYVFQTTPVLAVTIEDKPGALVHILEALEASDINVEYAYAFTAQKVGEAYIILRVADPDKAGKVLNYAGIRLLSTEDLTKL